MQTPIVSTVAEDTGDNGTLSQEQIDSVLDRFVSEADLGGERVLLVIPDSTRTAPVGQLFKGLHRRLSRRVKALDVIVALGTHPPMSDAAINHRLEITSAERAKRYCDVQIFNHTWDQPDTLMEIGRIPAEEITMLSGGLFSMEVPVHINKRVADYSVLIVIGPVFPHEVVGFSGGNKYFFPGIAGPDVLNFFHWLGAIVTNPMIIGNKWTPVRKVVDRAASFIKARRLCLAAVVDDKRFAGLYAGTTESAWDAASDLSAQLHIERKAKPFVRVLSCAPPMYDELWVAGKCMYKLEPVVADGGELIIYAPHLHEISKVHGHLIRRIGYHCRDYFLAQWERFRNEPWGVLAHSTHVRGIGTFLDGVEHPRIQVTLASQIEERVCCEINLGYLDPNKIDKEEFTDREEEGVLIVTKAGERLFHLQTPPSWAGGRV